jgi:hypothetical protein
MRRSNELTIEEMGFPQLKRILAQEIWPKLLQENEHYSVGICAGRGDHRSFFGRLSIPTSYVDQKMDHNFPLSSHILCKNHAENASLKCSLAYTLRLLNYCPTWKKAAQEMVSVCGYVADDTLPRAMETLTLSE